ncbi:hypothetical protein ACHHYP_20754 [Achlya hypogyna]|uniref:Uncharacterized protein n=1 Tax=Achlya hypogyna TaxID=1202772 RepID=A0A1V9YBY3_ACHHY|nr:hypothetical protein ACHHYP_20754 [Achlya hypogyna]
MQDTLTATAAPATVTTASIHAVFRRMAANDVAKHFEASPNPEPLVVMSGVSITLFNKYFAEHDEDAPVAMRFVNLVDGSIVITDYPSAAHEGVTMPFVTLLDQASGVPGCIALRGSTTAHRAGFVSKEADATFGPYDNTPNCGPLPTGLSSFGDWMTLVLEVGYGQSWRGLHEAASWWAMYPGVRYILLIRVGPRAASLEYELYHIDSVGPLSAVFQVGRMLAGNREPRFVSFDTRTILGIPPGLPLPANVNDVCRVDLLTINHRAFHNT